MKVDPEELKRLIAAGMPRLLVDFALLSNATTPQSLEFIRAVESSPETPEPVKAISVAIKRAFFYGHKKAFAPDPRVINMIAMLLASIWGERARMAVAIKAGLTVEFSTEELHAATSGLCPCEKCKKEREQG